MSSPSSGSRASLVEAFLRGKLRPVRILLVDDDEDLFVLLAAKLDPYNCELIQARTGIEGINRFHTDDPDMAWIDIDLGAGMDGIETSKAMRAHDPFFPVTFISGNPQSLVGHQARLGIFLMMLKPDSIDDDAAHGIAAHYNIPLKVSQSPKSDPASGGADSDAASDGGGGSPGSGST